MRKINLQSIGDDKFLKYHFIIPFYQRGYRWSEKEVTELLDDILEFQDKDKEKGEFYCLQPVFVIRKKDKENTFEVIDGQQRLTTIFILLSFLKNTREDDRGSSELFTIEYETREKPGVSSKEFLSNLENITDYNRANPDFYHISKAYLTIKEWFAKKRISKAGFLNTILDTKFEQNVDIKNNIRFIWYEVSDEEIESENDGVIEIFNRLNRGKIPLTNAELVKALFFITDKKELDKKKQQLQKGFEWDHIENTLQNKNFWYFLTKEHYRGSNHIEFIFDLIAEKYVHLTTLEKYRTDKLFTFLVFNELISKKMLPLEGNNTPEQTKDFLWNEIKDYHRLLVDFHTDPENYHLIGFLNQVEAKAMPTIIKLHEGSSKKEFTEKLKEKIRTFVSCNISELSYENDYDKIRYILLLYNVLITMKSNYMRFPFDLFVEQFWSLEHIHAQNTASLGDRQKKQLLEDQLEFFKSKNPEFAKRIIDILSVKDINVSDFETLQDNIFSQYSNKISEHAIQNMALLSKDDNSTLNNNIFPMKRNQIRLLDEKGSFIPLGTKNVFQKYYSENVNQNVSWDVQDQLAYLEDIKNVLKNYLPNTTKDEL